MRKMFVVTAWLVLILVSCALLMNMLEPVHRVVLLLAASVVGDVYIVCRARVERAKAPLILRDESVHEHSHPPEGSAE